MPYAINEAPKYAIFILLGTAPERTFTRSNQFPNEVPVTEDEDYKHYITSLAQVLFAKDQPQTEEHLHWQLRQTYRILNFASVSNHPSMQVCKKKLLRLKNELEQIPHIKEWLESIDRGTELVDLLCIGHGKCTVADGFIKNYHGSDVLLYSPIGVEISVDFATAVECNGLKKENIYIQNTEICDLSFIPENFKFPKVYNQTFAEKLPNLTLYTHGCLKARIVESKTGRVLFETNDKIKLSDILTKFPRSKLIWSACTVVREAGRLLGPNRDYRVDYAVKAGETDGLRDEAVVIKLRSAPKMITYDHNFTLFGNDRRGTVNPEIQRAIKRMRPNNPA